MDCYCIKKSEGLKRERDGNWYDFMTKLQICGQANNIMVSNEKWLRSVKSVKSIKDIYENGWSNKMAVEMGGGKE